MNMLAPTVKNVFAPVSLDRPVCQSGFDNEFATEALPDALPHSRNSPQRASCGLYAEQISDMAFTIPRAYNRRSWFYRTRPGMVHLSLEAMAQGCFHSNPNEAPPSLNQLHWDPLPAPAIGTDFIDGIVTSVGNGGPDAQAGCGIHLHAVNASMMERLSYNADGELLIVPQQGRLRLLMEMGAVDVEPLETVVIPRGVRFRVELPGGDARDYICENFGASFRLPDLGVISLDGPVNPRDFFTPHAWYEDREGNFELVAEFQGSLQTAKIGHSPLDVVAWHGNLVPYKYDLRLFNTIGSVSYDHPDPPVFLVLQSPSDTPGVDTIDLVISPPCWLAAENIFRPPWFHRDVANEFMGLTQGAYDAKAGGSVPGDASLHNCMSGHGPDVDTFEKASNGDITKPHKTDATMAFMFETPVVVRPIRSVVESVQLQAKYFECWQGLKKHLDPIKR